MKLLILGGTVFLGPHLVAAARAAGHEVTLFHRGRHGADLFPDVETIQGDRDGGLALLAGRHWDAAIDTSGYVPRLVHDSAAALAETVDHYTFISTLSVFADFRTPGMDESAPLGTLPDPATEEVTGETYGPLKALCEAAAEAALPGRVLTIRPGLLVGPGDPTDRFTYWPRRVAAGGEVLAPGRPGRPVQFIDARDLAEWTIRMVTAGRTGIYNAAGPAAPLAMQTLLDTCRAASGSTARVTWVDEPFLLAAEVAPWSELPLWVPESDESYAGFSAVDCRKAGAAGLTFRPLAATVRDTLAWDAGRPVEARRAGSLTPEREAALLAAWHAGATPPAP